MKRLWLLLLASCAGAPAPTLTVARIYSDPPLSGTLPSAPEWREDSKAITFVEDGKRIEFDLETGGRRPAAEAPQRIVVRNHDLWLGERRLTTGGSETLLHGELDWVYPEELGIRRGFEESEDGRRIAFLELDESKVSRFPLVDYSKPVAEVRWMFYPKAGGANPVARVGIVDLEGNVEWTPVKDEYVARMQWHRGRLYVQTLNRAQNRLTLWIDGVPQVLEESDSWIGVDDLHFLGDRIVRLSEKSGWRHIDGFTSGEWEVSDIAGVRGGWIYYHSNEGNDFERHLWRVNEKGRERLTKEPGWHQCVVSPDGSAWWDQWSSATARPRVAVGRHGFGTHPPLEPLPTPEFFRIDGMRAMVLKPPGFDPSKQYPVLIYAYGGPGSQVVANRWGGGTYLWHAAMAQRGFVVFSIDGPGSGGRGRDFTRRLFRQTGKAELEGQLRGVQWLRAQPWAGKIGIWGWSYGGYMTCYAMTHSDAFAAGVAVAPVTDWRFYDTIYTERYLRTPRENPDGYRLSSPDPAALRGRLLVVHGLSDDNVHWQNTVQFLDGLIRHNAKFDVQVYPAKDHGIWGRQVRTHLFETMTAFFERELR